MTVLQIIQILFTLASIIVALMVYRGTKKYIEMVTSLRIKNYELETRVRSLEDTMKDINHYFRDLK